MFFKSKYSLFSHTTLIILLILYVTQANAYENNLITHEEYSMSIYSELVELRRDLFEHPEMSGHEKRTSEIIANYLRNLGLEVKTNVGGYGVVGTLQEKSNV